MERLFTYLESIHPLTREMRDVLTKEMTLLSLPENHPLLVPPHVADHLYFLESGFAMSYQIASKQKRILKFWQAGQLIASSKSFFEQVPSREFIVLTMKSKVWFIPYSSVIHLIQKYESARIIQGTISLLYYQESRERLKLLRTRNPEAEYNFLRKQFPLIEQFVPQEDIASYLGITPQSLSRIKRRAKKKKS